MAVLLSLILGSVAARIVGSLGVDYAAGWPAAIAVGLALMFVMTGVAHFAPGMRRDMIAIVPPRLPKPLLLVAVTGALELLGALGLLYPPTRFAAAACLVRAHAGDVPGQRPCVPDAQPAKVDGLAAKRPEWGRGGLPGRCRDGRGLRWLAPTRTGTPLPSIARNVR